MAKTVVLVGCGKEKLDHAALAKDLYTGSLFRKARAYAERFGDEWGILSAKHGLVMPDQIVEPYDLALKDLDSDQLLAWTKQTNAALLRTWPGEFFICLAGAFYGDAFQSPVKLTVEYPMAGLGLGERLHYLNEAMKGSKGGHSLHDRSL